MSEHAETTRPGRLTTRFEVHRRRPERVPAPAIGPASNLQLLRAALAQALADWQSQDLREEFLEGYPLTPFHSKKRSLCSGW